jgi:hypothetical protein
MQPADLQLLWNQLVGDKLPKWLEMGNQRNALAALRLRECADSSRWSIAIQRMCKSAFLTGRVGESTWRASPDWLLKPGSLTAIEEGKYDDPKDRAPEAAKRNWKDLAYMLGPKPFSGTISDDERAAAEKRGRELIETERRTGRKVSY